MLSLVTIAAVPESYRCFIDGVDTSDSPALWNSSAVLAAIPMKGDVLDQCHMIGKGTNATVSCTSFVYDKTIYKDSRAMDWDLVCDHEWMGKIAQTIYMLGVLTGALILGPLADKIGRKKVFCWSGLLQLILGTGVAFIPEYYTFLVVRYLYGIFGSAGSYITGFVLTMELVGPSKRTPCGVAFQATFATGIMLVAAWGYYIPSRQTLQIVYGLHGLLLLPHWFIMDESPRWLWAEGREKEAIAIVTKGVEMNKRGIAVDKEYFLNKAKSAKEKGSLEEPPAAGVGALFKFPNLRMKTLNVCLCWFANSIAYYGLTLSSGKLKGNPYFLLFATSAVELPSYVVTVILMDRIGRRSVTSSFMLIGGIACIGATFLALKSTEATTCAMIGKLFIAGSFAVIYNYSAELFPTPVRNSAMGLGSVCARLAGSFTPLITLLDSLNPKIPAIIFGLIALISGLWVLYLPETLHHPMPETIEDGENFGKGDTCFTTCLGRRPAPDAENHNNMVPMETIR